VKTSSAPSISFDDLGDREPALLLMPGWCGPRTLFRGVLADHAQSRRVVALDWRGHGASARSPADFGYAELVDDAVRVLDAAGIDRVIPVGVSHAGWAAIDLRRRLGPSRVPGVVFVDWMVLGAPPPFIEALAGLQHPEHWTQVRARLFEMWTTGVDLPALGDYILEMKTADRAMWARAAREIGARFAAEPSPLALLEREAVPCPALHVYAQPADPGLLAAQQAYAATHTWFSVHHLAAASHFPMLEHPRALVARIESFAAALSG
jgi:pimeloyl-ACP methyl ester carboxylesterase